MVGCMDVWMISWTPLWNKKIICNQSNSVFNRNETVLFLISQFQSYFMDVFLSVKQLAQYLIIIIFINAAAIIIAVIIIIIVVIVITIIITNER